MLQTAMVKMADNEEAQGRLIELIVSVADTYLNEGRHDLAKEWYAKALQHAERHFGQHSMKVANITIRLAETSILQADMKEYERHFDYVQRIYLLCEDENISSMLGGLIDLSWAICVQGRTAEIRPVNELIEQIKQISAEDKILSAA